MNITPRYIGDVAILDLDGRLNIGDGDVKLRDALVAELEGGRTNILINLKKVKQIDSSGLGELIRCKVTCAGKNAAVKLLHVNIAARKLLTMAQLVGVFDMFDEEEPALASFDD